MRIAAVVLAAVLGSSVTAAAQPGLTPPQEPDGEQPTNGPTLPPSPPPPMPGYYVYGPAPVPMAMPAPMIEGKTKSEGTATMLALGTTAGGFALLAAAGNQNEGGGGMATLGVLALLIGPSAGHIYSGETGHAVGMSLVRGGAAIAFLAGVLKQTMVYGAQADCFEQCTGLKSDDDNGATLMWVGGLTFVAATVYDIIDAPRSARRRNVKERQYAVQPMIVGTTNARTPGIGFAGKF